MDNQKLINLIANWRNTAQESIENKKNFLAPLSDNERYLIASILEQCADELGNLVVKEGLNG